MPNVVLFVLLICCYGRQDACWILISLEIDDMYQYMSVSKKVFHNNNDNTHLQTPKMLK